jgi:uroporphyrinogen-III synthase
MPGLIPRLILTRPEPDNAVWQEALIQAGMRVEAWPLIEIRAMPDADVLLNRAWQGLHECRASMFVSRAAVQHFFACKPLEKAWPESCRAWCTGPGTRRALLEQGLAVSLIDTPPQDTAWDTEHLWPVVQAQIRPKDVVLFVRGTDAGSPVATTQDDVGIGRDWLAAQVMAAHGQLRWAVSYQRACPHWGPDQIKRAQAAMADGSVWLFSSSLALKHWASLVPRPSGFKARAIATHARIAQKALELGFGQVRTCQPALDQVRASLESFT